MKKKWDLRYKYTHNQLESNPLLDVNGDSYSWWKTPMTGKVVKVYTCFQARIIRRRGGIPKLFVKKRKKK